MSEQDLTVVLFDLLEGLIDPLARAAGNVETLTDADGTTYIHHTGLILLLQDIGFAQVVGEETAAALPDLADKILQAADSLTALDVETVELGKVVDAAFAVLVTIQDLVQVVEALRTDLGDSPVAGDIPTDLLTRLWHWMIWKHLEAGPAPLMAFARLTGMITVPDDSQTVAFDLAPLMGLVKDPSDVFFQAFGWGSDDIDTMLVLSELKRVADACGLPAEYRARDVAGHEVMALHITLLDIERPDPDNFDPFSMAGEGPEAGIWIGVGTPLEPKGLSFGFWGEAQPSLLQTIGNGTSLTVSAEAEATDLPTASLGPSGVTLSVRPPPGLEGQVTLSAARSSDPPMTLLPLGAFGGLSAAEVGGAVTVDMDGTLGLTAAIKDGLLEVKPGQPDSFLALLLPADGFSVPFDITAAWRDGSGIKVDGSANLDIDMPIGRSILDALRIETLHMRVPLIPLEGPEATLAVTGGGTLGPIAVSIRKIGVRLRGRRAEAAGDNGLRQAGAGFILRLGNLELEAELKRPDGVGLALDLGAAKGGGFLEIGDHRYAGALGIEAGSLALQAFGVLTTQRPDGSDGFSLLAFVSGQFSPIQLGFGFTLMGVGGIVGLHRDVNPDALFAAVEAGTAGDLLAPKDPVGDAPRLIALAEGIFPQAPGQYVFGPTVKLGWGTPTLLELDLALAATLPEPLRLVLIGRLQGALPDEKLPVIQLKIDLAGVLDITGGSLNLRGQVFDSTVQLIPIQGGFALVTAWKGSRELVFSVGGFHPAFEAPARFPTVIRMGACLTKGRSLRLALLGYFAITPNTLQLGAMAELRVSAAGYTLLGELGFDALIEFSPFRMQLGIQARVQVKRGSRSLCQLSFKGHLAGPNAWTVNGQAIIEIPFLSDIKVAASASFGRAAQVLNDPVDVARQVRDALADPASWRPDGPTAHFIMVSDDPLLCSPTGTVQVTQKVAPLGVDWHVFYGKPIAGAQRMDLPQVTGRDGGVLTHGDTIGGAFPPGAFRSLPEKARLDAPAFETLTAGFTLDPAALHAEGKDTPKDTSRQVRIFGREPGPATSGTDLPGFALDPVPVGEPMVGLIDEPWVEAGPGGADPGAPTSWTEAQQTGSSRTMLAGECP